MHAYDVLCRGCTSFAGLRVVVSWCGNPSIQASAVSHRLVDYSDPTVQYIVVYWLSM
jgi:hypothetical protein